jgi:AP-5 complex subunit beta-1
MDSKFADIVTRLRRHFSSIPDFRHMPGFKITICCSLRFESEPFNRIWGSNKSESLPAIYATVLTFSSSAPYGSIPSFHVPFLLGESVKANDSASPTDSLAMIPVESNNSTEEESLEGYRAPVMVELEPHEPVPGLVNVSVEANVENGEIIRGNLRSITVGIEDMFMKAVVPEDIEQDAVRDYIVDLFDALWEACETSSSTGREAFLLKGGKGAAAMSGTRSVKLLEVCADTLIRAVERHLSPFVVSVVGEPLVSIVKDGGIIKDAVWKYSGTDSVLAAEPGYNAGPLYLKDKEDEEESGARSSLHKRSMGNFNVLIFLPPWFHLLFQMEVSDTSTLVRIRTDHWPSLAYIDEYLEALFFGWTRLCSI